MIGKFKYRRKGIIWQIARQYHLARYRRMRNFIPDDEFHPSLSMDETLLEYMNDEERQDYCANLVRRRNKAHERTLAAP